MSTRQDTEELCEDAAPASSPSPQQQGQENNETPLHASVASGTVPSTRSSSSNNDDDDDDSDSSSSDENENNHLDRCVECMMTISSSKRRRTEGKVGDGKSPAYCTTSALSLIKWISKKEANSSSSNGKDETKITPATAAAKDLDRIYLECSSLKCPIFAHPHLQFTQVHPTLLQVDITSEEKKQKEEEEMVDKPKSRSNSDSSVSNSSSKSTVSCLRPQFVISGNPKEDFVVCTLRQRLFQLSHSSVSVVMHIAGKERLNSEVEKKLHEEERSRFWYQKWEWVFDIARGIRFMHANGVLHRDIKAENVFLDQNRRARIGDLGFSFDTSHEEEEGGGGVDNNNDNSNKMQDVEEEKGGVDCPHCGAVIPSSSSSSSLHHPCSEIIKKSIPWLAPELIQALVAARKNKGEITPRCCYTRQTDVFAFGMLLYEIFTHELPWSVEAKEQQKNVNLVAWNGILSNQRPTLEIESSIPPPPSLSSTASSRSLLSDLPECGKKFSELLKDCWRTEILARPKMDTIVETAKKMVLEGDENSLLATKSHLEAAYKPKINQLKKEIENRSNFIANSSNSNNNTNMRCPPVLLWRTSSACDDDIRQQCTFPLEEDTQESSRASSLSTIAASDLLNFQKAVVLREKRKMPDDMLRLLPQSSRPRFGDDDDDRDNKYLIEEVQSLAAPTMEDQDRPSSSSSSAAPPSRLYLSSSCSSSERGSSKLDQPMQQQQQQQQQQSLPLPPPLSSPPTLMNDEEDENNEYKSWSFSDKIERLHKESQYRAAMCNENFDKPTTSDDNNNSNSNNNNNDVRLASEFFKIGLQLLTRAIDSGRDFQSDQGSTELTLLTAKDNFSQAYQGWKRSDNPNPSAVANALFYVGLCTEELAKYKAVKETQQHPSDDLLREAMAVFGRVVSLRSESLGVENPETATAHFKVGAMAMRLREFPTAIRNFSQALQTRKVIYGDQSSQVSDVLLKLGLCHAEMENFETAFDFFSQSFHIRKASLGFDSLDTANSLYNMGVALTKSANGNMEDACKYLQDAIEIQTKISFGLVKVAATSYALAIAQEKRGNVEAALVYHTQTLKYRLEIANSIDNSIDKSKSPLSPEERDVATCLFSIGVFLSNLGGQEMEAVSLFSRAFRLRSRDAQTANAVGVVEAVEAMVEVAKKAQSSSSISAVTNCLKESAKLAEEKWGSGNNISTLLSETLRALDSQEETAPATIRDSLMQASALESEDRNEEAYSLLELIRPQAAAAEEGGDRELLGDIVFAMGVSSERMADDNVDDLAKRNELLSRAANFYAEAYNIRTQLSPSQQQQQHLLLSSLTPMFRRAVVLEKNNCLSDAVTCFTMVSQVWETWEEENTVNNSISMSDGDEPPPPPPPPPCAAVADLAAQSAFWKGLIGERQDELQDACSNFELAVHIWSFLTENAKKKSISNGNHDEPSPSPPSPPSPPPLEQLEQSLGNAYFRLGLALAKSNDPVKSMEMLSCAWDIRSRILGVVHPHTANVCFHMGLIKEAIGDLDGAEKDFTQAADIRAQALGENHPETTMARQVAQDISDSKMKGE